MNFIFFSIYGGGLSAVRLSMLLFDLAFRWFIYLFIYLGLCVAIRGRGVSRNDGERRVGKTSGGPGPVGGGAGGVGGTRGACSAWSCGKPWIKQLTINTNHIN